MDDAAPETTPPRLRRALPPLLIAAAIALFGYYRVQVGLLVLLLAAVTFICSLTHLFSDADSAPLRPDLARRHLRGDLPFLSG